MSWQTVSLAEAATLRTGKLDSNAAVPGGEYPFFTCAQETFRIDNFAFDTEAVLLAGNNAAGIFSLKYYRGQFNAYQRTYVIETRNAEMLSTRYLFYALKPALAHFKSASIGAATQYLTKGILDNFQLRLPPSDVQRAIVSVMANYDDLIENNVRRIELLEQSARLLFKEWFVHLRYPGHEHNKIVDGVPKGWERKKVGALLAKVPPTKKIMKEDFLENGETPCVDQSRKFIGGYTDDAEARIESPLPMIVFGDHTRILKFIDFPFARGADGTQLLYPNHPRILPEFFYFLLDAIDLSNYFYARHFKFLKAQEVLIPSERLIREFTAFAKDAMKEVAVLSQCSRVLGKARDLLLVRLMDGRITV